MCSSISSQLAAEGGAWFEVRSLFRLTIGLSRVCTVRYPKLGRASARSRMRSRRTDCTFALRAGGHAPVGAKGRRRNRPGDSQGSLSTSSSRPGGEAAGDIHFDEHGVGVDSHHSGRLDGGEHAACYIGIGRRLSSR